MLLAKQQSPSSSSSSLHHQRPFFINKYYFIRMLAVTTVVMILLVLHQSKRANSSADMAIELTSTTTTLPPNASPEKDWALNVTKHQRRVYSQRSQDGSLQYIFKNIGTLNRKFVEFGFSSNSMEVGTGPNTRLLWSQGWTGLLLDGSHENATINLQKLWIEPDTVVRELRKRGVTESTDYISVDFDSADCFAMEAIACELRPRVLTVEYNSNWPLEATIAHIGGKDYNWERDGDRLFGCGLGTHALIAQRCGYTIVDVIARLDNVMVRNDLLINTQVYPVENWRRYTKLPVHKPTRLQDQDKYLCDYRVYLETRIIADCIGEPVRQLLKRLNFSLGGAKAG